MDQTRRAIFDKYFNALAAQKLAVSPQDKLALLDELYQKAVEQGLVPISAQPVQIAQVNPQSPRAQAILEGREVSLGDVTIQSTPSLQDRLAGMSNGRKVLLLLAVLILPVLLFFGLSALSNARRNALAAAATIPPTQTVTLAPTETAEPVYLADATGTPYAMIVATAKPPTGVNDPVSVEFGGVTFLLYQSSVVNGEWRPSVAEWLEDTELRRVLAVPYSVEVGNAVAGMKYADPVKLRLLSGEVVTYRLVEIARIKRHQIEYLTELSPGLAIVLYGERSTDRYVLIAEAVQPGSEVLLTPTVTPSLPPSPTAEITGTLEITPTASPTAVPSATPTASRTAPPSATPTPAFAFTPPALVTVVITETQTVENEVAGIRLAVSNCIRVAQIGSQKGRFMICDVTLTALRAGAGYSGQTLAITEFAQVSKTTGWWPPTLTVIGGIGDGTFARAGNSISGKVAGTVAKPGLNSSNPVLLWEQDGTRFVIYLEP